MGIERGGGGEGEGGEGVHGKGRELGRGNWEGKGRAETKGLKGLAQGAYPYTPFPTRAGPSALRKCAVKG